MQSRRYLLWDFLLPYNCFCSPFCYWFLCFLFQNLVELWQNTRQQWMRMAIQFWMTREMKRLWKRKFVVSKAVPIQNGWKSMASMKTPTLSNSWMPSSYLQEGSKERKDTIPHLYGNAQELVSKANAKTMNMGTPLYYPKFIPFKLIEIKKFMPLYMFQGLNPLPQIEYKFKSNNDNPIHGDDWFRCIMHNYQLYVGCGSSSVALPPRIRAFQSHPKNTSKLEGRPSTWAPSGSKKICTEIGTRSCREWADNWLQRPLWTHKTNYVQEGRQWFPSWCHLWWWLHVLFLFPQSASSVKVSQARIVPTPLKMHGPLWLFFQQLPPSLFDNLYMSAKFALAAYCHKRKVMIEGMTRTNCCGIPRQVV